MNANAKVTEDNKVKITGLTRRVDSLGRIVIPKELPRMLHIKEGSPLEIYMDKRKSALYSKKDDNLISVVKDDEADCEAQAIAAIVHDGDSAGAVILCAYAEQGDKLEIVEKLVSAAAEFPGLLHA